MQRKGKERKGKESIIKDNNISIESQHTPTRSIFQKPSIQELKDYCLENNIVIDFDYFYDYYEGN
jgi:hypothetical protein